MSPASRSKSKDKKASKEIQKAATSKPTGTATAGSGSSSIPASGYNPLSGTFHTLESQVSAALPLHSNGRFKNIDDTDAQSGVILSPGVVEYDSVSNNGSWSGESEDHKDKKPNPAVRQETIPGADIDKREKIRQKNEKKHQRQKEKRAQELHERCSGYLMSRKLEALAQQLVAMGFSQERATIALILNEGKIEESVAWLLEGGEEAADSGNQNISGQNLKIDISEELAHISAMETQYKCSKQEVERAVVACEGDLEKAAESLRELKLDPPSAPPKPEETGDPPTAISSKFPGNTSQTLRPQMKANPLSIQQRKEEKDFNYTKAAMTVGMPTESVGKNIPQPLKRSHQPKMEWGNYEQITTAEKRWPTAGAASPISYSLASSPTTQLSSPLRKNEPRYLTVGNEFNGIQSGLLRDPSIVVQGRHPSFDTKQASATSISSSPPAGWYSTNGIEIMKSSGGYLPQIHGSTSFKTSDVTLNQAFPQVQYQAQQQFVPGNRRGDFLEANHTDTSWSRAGASSSPIAAASSLGLFSGLSSTGQSGASSPVDWNVGNSMPYLDYSDIDWSVDRGLSSARSGGGGGGLLQGLNSYMQKNGRLYESNVLGVETQPFMSSMASNFSRVSTAGLQNGGVASETTANGSSREWTSPFEGKDIFSFPRQFVFSPP